MGNWIGRHEDAPNYCLLLAELSRQDFSFLFFFPFFFVFPVALHFFFFFGTFFFTLFPRPSDSHDPTINGFFLDQVNYLSKFFSPSYSSDAFFICIRSGFAHRRVVNFIQVLPIFLEFYFVIKRATWILSLIRRHVINK